MCSPISADSIFGILDNMCNTETLINHWQQLVKIKNRWLAKTCCWRAASCFSLSIASVSSSEVLSSDDSSFAKLPAFTAVAVVSNDVTRANRASKASYEPKKFTNLPNYTHTHKYVHLIRICDFSKLKWKTGSENCWAVSFHKPDVLCQWWFPTNKINAIRAKNN